jgi:urease subunit alpha
MPYTVNTLDEHLDMLLVCHHLNSQVPEDVAFAESRIRPETMAAEDVLHDLGAISMMSSDSQAMGRVGESVTRAFQIAHHCKALRVALPEDSGANDNERVLRFLAKVTINPAITNGVGHAIGSIAPGKIADLVQWPIASFAAKPRLVVKGGLINWAAMGDPNASLPTPQPIFYRHMFGAYGRARQTTGVTFMSQAAIAAGVPERLDLHRQIIPVRNCRSIGKQHMVRNFRIPDIQVDPETFKVSVDGEITTIDPAQELPLTRLFFMV